MKRRDLLDVEFLEDSEYERRDLLKAGGVAGGAGVLGIGAYTIASSGNDDEQEINSVIEPPDENPTEEPPDTNPPSEREQIPHAAEFQSVVDVVEIGADPEGQSSVNFLFSQNLEDDTLLAFQPGTYQIDPFQLTGNHLGMVNTGDEPVRFVPSDGNCRGGNPYIFFDRVSDLVLENITFDFTNSEAGGPLHFFLTGDSTVRNMTYEGTCSNQLGIMRVEVLDENGSVLFENLQARNIDEDHTLTGVYVSGNHAGEATFRDCNLEEFSDNGLYASAPGGPGGQDGAVNVEGGVYRNNNISNVRLGSTGSIAQDVDVIVDSETPGWGQLNSRGIRLRNKSGQLIDNCSITFEQEAADSFGGVVFHTKNSGGLVRDTTIRVRRDEIPAVKAFSVTNAGNSSPEFEEVVITGDATEGVAVDIEGRDETEFRGCTIIQNGSNRDGIQLVDSHDCRIVDSHIFVAGDPIILRNASVHVENTEFVTEDERYHIEDRLLEDETLTLE